MRSGADPSEWAVGGGPLSARPIRLFAVVFVAYAVGAWFSWQAFGTATTAAFFPPAGVTVAAMLLTRRALWPVIAAAIVFGELLIDLSNGFTVPFAAGLALGNVVEPLVGASLVRAGCGGVPDLRRLRDLVIFVAGAAVAGPLVGGVVGGGTAWWLKGASWAEGVLHWFAGDGIAVLVVGTPILLWRAQSAIIKSRPLETVTILAAAAVLSIVAFRTNLPPGTALLPFLAIAALRLGVIGTALAGLLAAAIGTVLTTSDHVALAQTFITVSVLTAMIIAQEVARRTLAVEAREVERGERVRMESLYADEHVRAVVLRSALHPDASVKAVGLEYCVYYQPCDEIQGLGGDWYDVLPLPDDKTYLAVGDVVGHGLQAVEDMAQLRNAGEGAGLPGAGRPTGLAPALRRCLHGHGAVPGVVPGFGENAPSASSIRHCDETRDPELDSVRRRREGSRRAQIGAFGSCDPRESATDAGGPNRLSAETRCAVALRALRRG